MLLYRDQKLFHCLPDTRRITGRSLEERSLHFPAISSVTRVPIRWATAMAADIITECKFLCYLCLTLSRTCNLRPSICEQDFAVSCTGRRNRTNSCWCAKAVLTRAIRLRYKSIRVSTFRSQTVVIFGRLSPTILALKILPRLKCYATSGAALYTIAIAWRSVATNGFD